MNLRRSIAAAALVAASCASQEPVKKTETPAAPASQVSAAQVKPVPPGIEAAVMDPSVDPCADFFQYACGGWLKTAQIPDDRPLYSRGFVAIAERNEKIEKEILEEAAAGKLPDGTPFAKHLSDYYASCTDEVALEKTALPQLQALLKKYAAPKNAAELSKNVAELHKLGMSPLFGVGAMQDLKNSTEVITGLDQAGLGLPDRDYYVEDEPKKKAVREAYGPYVARMLTLLGEKDAARQSAAIVELETRLAKASQTKTERRDPTKLYNRIEKQGLKKQASSFGWDSYFAAVGLPKVEAVNVSSVKYFEEVGAAAKTVKPEVWKAYLTWTILRSNVGAMPKAFQDESFAFTSTHLTGAKADRPRWKKCVNWVEGDLGEALGREFVRRTFGEDGKKRTNAMVQALQAAFKGNLANLKWMDDATRAAAATKLERMVGNNKIGFPDAWRDYSAITTSRDSFLTNSLEASRFEFARQLKKIGAPVDRAEWLMHPAMVNAYNEGQKNEIVFPAGILQPPFFNRDATDAVNFGSMGMVVGHEITHGFDDEGRQFDVDGNLKDWWTPEVGKRFEERVACVEKQYDNYVAIDELKVKGKLTLGENVADLGGLKLAHNALLSWYAGKPAAELTQYRFTPSQQFFLGFAQSWCTKVRPQEAARRAAVDPHSPPVYRVNGPLGNLEAFRAAFSCKPGSALLREGDARCEVW